MPEVNVKLRNFRKAKLEESSGTRGILMKCRARKPNMLKLRKAQ